MHDPSTPSDDENRDPNQDLHAFYDELDFDDEEQAGEMPSDAIVPVVRYVQPVAPPPPPARTSGWRPLHLILIVLTCVSTFYVGQNMGDLHELVTALRAGDIAQDDLNAIAKAGAALRMEARQGDPKSLASAEWNLGMTIKKVQDKHITPEDRRWSGFVYAACVMFTLFFHEMGHYLQAIRYGAVVSPPYFIPIPNLFGTMGAVIVQRSGYRNRKVLYDIAISGPLAGLVLAIPIVWFGVQNCVIATPAEMNTLFSVANGMEYGDPLLIQWMYEAAHGPLQPGELVISNPLLFAGWVGIFITALNLIPIGQLDGGHILYALLGKRAHFVAIALCGLALTFMIYTKNPSYALMLVLIMFMGVRHPPTERDDQPLDWFRVILGWLTLAFIVIGFTPTPIVM